LRLLNRFARDRGIVRAVIRQSAIGESALRAVAVWNRKIDGTREWCIVGELLRLCTRFCKRLCRGLEE